MTEFSKLIAELLPYSTLPNPSPPLILLQVLAWGVGQVREIVSRPPLRSCVEAEVSPGAQVHGHAALTQWVVEHTLPNSHWAGTAKMGLKNDSTAVVDASLRVRGIQNLRVAGECS